MMILRQDEVMDELVNPHFAYGDSIRGLIQTLVRQAYEEGVCDGYNAVYDSSVRDEIEIFLAAK